MNYKQMIWSADEAGIEIVVGLRKSMFGHLVIAQVTKRIFERFTLR